MNYVHNIYLNFNKYLYDFFDWNKSDKIIHIKKIPFFKVDNNILLELINNKIKLDNYILELLKNNTEIHSIKKKKLKYASLFGNDDKIIAIMFDDNGISQKYSSLNITDELNIAEVIDIFEEYDFKYEVIEGHINKNLFQIRYEFYYNKIIKDSIMKMIKNNEYDKLKYLYFECFNKLENNTSELEELSNVVFDYKMLKKIIDIFSLDNKKRIT